MATWTPEQFDRALRRAIANVPKHVAGALNDAFDTIVADAEAVTAVGETGQLRKGWEVRILPDRVTLKNNTYYARWQRDKTGDKKHLMTKALHNAHRGRERAQELLLELLTKL